MLIPDRTDIIKRKKGGLIQLWLSENYLIKAAGVSYDYLWKNRNITKAWNYMSINSIRYYEYYSIPDRAPKHYRSQLPDFDSILSVADGSETTVPDYPESFESAIDNYSSYEHLYNTAPDDKRKALSVAASVVESTSTYIRLTNYSTRKYDLFNQLCELVKTHDVKYIPRNVRRAKQKIVQHLNGVPVEELIKLPRSGNSNAAKFKTDVELETWIYELASNPKNFSDEYIIRKVKHLCELAGKTIPSNSTLKKYLLDRQTKFLTSVNRYGSGSSNAAQYEGCIPLAKAPHAGDAWQIDATRVNFIAHERIIETKDGQTKKIQSNIMVCVVRDVYSGEALGYSFNYAEDHVMVHNALKMAVENAGYLPYELIMDRYPGHNKPESIGIRETMKLMGVKITITHKATGKSAMERWFNTMQQIEMQGHDYYYGEGIKSKRKAAHPSADHLASMRKKAKKEAYNLHDTVTAYADMIENHNKRNYCEYSRKYRNVKQSPAELHKESTKPNVIRVTDVKIRQIFGIKTIVKTPGNGLVKITVRQVDHYYKIEDYSVVRDNDKLVIAYDFEDMSNVSIFKQVPQSSWLVHLGNAGQFNPVKIHGPQAEFNRLSKMKRQVKAFEQMRQAELADKLNISPENESEIFNAEEELLMGQHTIKKAAGAFEDIEMTDQDIDKSIYKQLYDN